MCHTPSPSSQSLPAPIGRSRKTKAVGPLLGVDRGALRRSATAPAYAPVFQEARGRHAALAPLESVDALLAALTPTTAETLDARDRLAFAIIAEERRTHSGLWIAAALFAFAPMLVRLRLRLGRLGAADLDAVVIDAFLQAVRSDRRITEGHVCVQLRCRTLRTVFQEMKREARESQHLGETVPEDAVGLGQIVSIAPAGSCAAEEQQDLSSLLGELAHGLLSPRQVDAIAHTLILRQPLSTWVRERFPDVVGERFRHVYQRERRHHQAAIARLREMLKGRDLPPNVVPLCARRKNADLPQGNGPAAAQSIV